MAVTTILNTHTKFRAEQFGINVGVSDYPRDIDLLRGLSFGAIRTHDKRPLTWAAMETAPGVYNLEPLRQQIKDANGRKIMFTLFKTPQFYAKNLDVGAYGPGYTSSPTDPVTVYNYLKAIFQEFPNQIDLLEVWNEPNWNGMWLGTMSELAAIIYQASLAVEEFSPNTRLLAPSITGLEVGNIVAGSPTDPQIFFPTLMNTLMPNGKKVHNAIDATNWHLYGLPANMLARITLVKSILAAYPEIQYKPYYNSEASYGVTPGNPSYTQKNAMRMLVLPVAMGFEASYLFQLGRPDVSGSYSLAGPSAVSGGDSALNRISTSLSNLLKNGCNTVGFESNGGGVIVDGYSW